jgi:hypothetical protein
MELLDHPNLPFVVDACGCFAPNRVHVRFDPRPRPTTPLLESVIDEEWQRQTARAEREDRMLFDGSLMRYVDHAVRQGRDGESASFHLTVGPTCYRDFVGTNLFNHHRLEEFGWHRFANPIGTTATLISRDGCICYGRRSARVAYHARHVHTFGGGLEEADRAADGTIDPFASLCRELDEELRLSRSDLADLVCVGLLRDKEICQPELLFEAGINLTAEELRTRWASATGRDEHEDIIAFPDEPAAIVPFIKGCGAIAPVAVGALFLHGRRRWGQAWFEAAAGKL